MEKKLKPKNNNSNNEIVIGWHAVGEGSNTVVLGNNMLTQTYLKGKINIDGAYVLPETTGQPGDVLKVPAAGGGNELVWGAPSSSSQWTNTGNDISNNNSGDIVLNSSSKLGVGVTNPDFPVEIYKSNNTSGDFINLKSHITGSSNGKALQGYSSNSGSDSYGVQGISAGYGTNQNFGGFFQVQSTSQGDNFGLYSSIDYASGGNNYGLYSNIMNICWNKLCNIC